MATDRVSAIISRSAALAAASISPRRVNAEVHMKRIVVLGAGFAGLTAAVGAARNRAGQPCLSIRSVAGVPLTDLSQPYSTFTVRSSKGAVYTKPLMRPNPGSPTRGPTAL